MNTATDDTRIEYAGFWVRVGASLIDTVLMLIVTTPLIVAVYGWDSLFTDTLLRGPLDLVISWIFPAAAVILFWIYKQATPGKMALSLRVVDADSGAPLSSRQSIVRYLGYFVAMIPLGIGLIWVGFSSKKQGWHDLLANTVVVRAKNRGTEPVRFARAE
jgi:uncharacterized RDD family membrane protein YckC